MIKPKLLGKTTIALQENSDSQKILDQQPRTHFDCDRCPAFCCAVYPRVAVTESDIQRLARHFKVSRDEAQRRCTRLHDGERVLRRQSDPLLGEACRFLDLKTRGCTIYHARPQTCRAYPERKRCAYYDLLRFEKRHQDDASVLPRITLEFVPRADERGDE